MVVVVTALAVAVVVHPISRQCLGITLKNKGKVGRSGMRYLQWISHELKFGGAAVILPVLY
jgi:hypothetical protein